VRSAIVQHSVWPTSARIAIGPSAIPVAPAIARESCKRGPDGGERADLVNAKAVCKRAIEIASTRGIAEHARCGEQPGGRKRSPSPAPPRSVIGVSRPARCAPVGHGWQALPDMSHFAAEF